MKSVTKIFFLTSLTLLGFPSLSQAHSGDLDFEFAHSGIMTVSFGGEDQAQSVALDSQGRIVSAGIYDSSTHHHLAIMRQLPDGGLDASFNGNGKIDVHFLGEGLSEGHAVAIQSDDKILGAGDLVVDDATGATDFALARFNDDGSLDASFGSLGVVIIDMGADDDTIVDMAIDATGRIVVVGLSGGDFAIARYQADGSLDAGFGSGGKVVTPVGSNSDFARALSLQADGKILVVGRSVQVGGTDIALVRYNDDGSLDGGFGSGGKVVTDLGSSADFGEDVVVQPDSKIVVAGFLFDGVKDNIALARYNSDGSLDAAFGTSGLVFTDFGHRSEANGVVLQPDGRIVVAGVASTGLEGNFALARYRADGSVDTSFGVSGLSVIDINAGHSDVAFDVVLQPDGKIVAVGSNSGDFAILRFDTKNSADLAIAGGVSVPTVVAGDTATFTVTVVNTGPDPATEVDVTGTLSTNLGLESLATTQGSCETSASFTCHLGTLENGAVAILTYSASAVVEGDVSSTVAVTTYDDDPDTSDNNALIDPDSPVSFPEAAAGSETGAGGDSGASDDSSGAGSDSSAEGSGGCSLIRD